MDPISQGVLGAVAAQNTSRKEHMVAAAILGLVGGMAPDLDVLINSDTDPLLFLEYHRQFTHSLIFIPAGGLICAFLIHWSIKILGKLPGPWPTRCGSMAFGQIFKYTTAGYATHALLDACTSYGTQLFWPFSNLRISWNNISIIDPLFTIPITVMVVLAASKRKPAFARLALAWVCIYLGFGLIQKERAENAGWELAQSRGHNPIRLEAKPGFGNLLLWKIIYETESDFYVDGIRAGLTTLIYPGDSIAKLDVSRDFPWLDPESQQAHDIERFSWFSDGFVSVHPDDSNSVIDVRYSMLPNEIKPLWMIILNHDASPGQHAGYAHGHRVANGTIKKFKKMLLGRNPS
jgi:inner membrane protein